MRASSTWALLCLWIWTHADIRSTASATQRTKGTTDQSCMCSVVSDSLQPMDCSSPWGGAALAPGSSLETLPLQTHLWEGKVRSPAPPALTPPKLQTQTLAFLPSSSPKAQGKGMRWGRESSWVPRWAGAPARSPGTSGQGCGGREPGLPASAPPSSRRRSSTALPLGDMWAVGPSVT